MINDEAIENLKRFYNLSNPSKEDIFLYEESLKYLIDTENNVWTMCELAGHYNEMKDFKMELKYYEMAAVEGELQKKEIDEVLAYEKRTFDPIELANVTVNFSNVKSSFRCETTKFNKTQNVVVDQPQLLHFIFDILCRYI